MKRKFSENHPDSSTALFNWGVFAVEQRLEYKKTKKAIKKENRHDTESKLPEVEANVKMAEKQFINAFKSFETELGQYSAKQDSAAFQVLRPKKNSLSTNIQQYFLDYIEWRCSEKKSRESTKILGAGGVSCEADLVGKWNHNKFWCDHASTGTSSVREITTRDSSGQTSHAFPIERYSMSSDIFLTK